MASKKSAQRETDPFFALTWSELEEWAGDKVVRRGKSYHRSGAVRQLARAEDGALIARVQGERLYQTQVRLTNGKLSDSCTCPYDWGACKHAVAVVLEYLDRLKRGDDVPLATEDIVVAVDDEEDAPGTWGDADDEEEEYQDIEDVEAEQASPRRSRGAAKRPSHLEDLRTYLEGHSKEQLVSLLHDLACSSSEVERTLTDRRDLEKGDSHRLVADLRKEIRELSSEPSWTDSWHDEGHVPDYSRVKERMEALLQAGQADALVNIGEELFRLGTEQVEQSHDEGEVGTEISECLDIVFRALPKSSLSPSHQLLWCINVFLQDEYALCDREDDSWAEGKSTGDWNEVADVLAKRVASLPTPREDSSDRYHRDRLTDWLIRALEKSGREAEIIPLCEREAAITGSHVRLVDRLLDKKRYEDAERWTLEGLKAVGDKWAGVRNELRERLRAIAEKTRKHDRVAALRAYEFFEAPSLKAYDELLKAAARVDCRDRVREAALRYLESGERPDRQKAPDSWPLPPAGLPETTPRGGSFPETQLLVEVALKEKRPDDALLWFDEHRKKYHYGGDNLAAEVASGVAGTHPDRAIEIWKRLAEGQIAVTQVSAYPVAAQYLRQVKKTLNRLGRVEEWNCYLANLRKANKRKRRLIEILDGLEGKRIVET